MRIPRAGQREPCGPGGSKDVSGKTFRSTSDYRSLTSCAGALRDFMSDIHPVRRRPGRSGEHQALVADDRQSSACPI
jgi:hypothetical protein